MRNLTYAVILALLTPLAAGHVGDHPSIHDTVVGVLERMQDSFTSQEMRALGQSDIVEFMTEEERHILGENYITFETSIPIVVSVMVDRNERRVPFWLEDRGFVESDDLVEVGGARFEVWERVFDAGLVGLGVSSLTGGDHYFLAVRPRDAREWEQLRITDIYPGQHRFARLEVGAQPYVDDNDAITLVPESMRGIWMIQTLSERERDAQVVGAFRETRDPATAAPDHVVLTWSEDPQTTQTIQWRTSTDVDTGVVAYGAAGDDFDPDAATRVDAQTKRMVTRMIVNDPVVHRHTATLRNLAPGTTYAYAVGDGAGNWRETAVFTTAPAETVPFTFIYMGDAQNGLDTWGELAHKSIRAQPDAAFYVMAGDLVDRGNDRDDWDHFFMNAEGIFDRKQMISVPGNHEYQGGAPAMYLDMFALPDESPVGELNYSVRYSNAHFIMLDSNISPTRQNEWLENELKNSDATWKFVVYHHPAYSSSPTRNNPQIRRYWTPLFDKYHVDVALQGHDHAYLRTYPMNNEAPIDSAKDGTVYIVSVSGTKYYDQGDFDYKAFGMTNTSTYQVLDIRIDGDTLTYRAYDIEGELRDEFVIEK